MAGDNVSNDSSKQDKHDTVASDEKVSSSSHTDTRSSEPLSYSYTEANGTVEDKKGSHDFRVSRTVNPGDNGSDTIVSETVSHEYQGEKQNHKDVKATIDRYSTGLGHKTHVTEYTTDSFYHDKDKTKLKETVETHRDITDTANDGTYAVSAQKTQPRSYGTEKETRTAFDKSGRVTSTEEHYKRTGDNPCQTDSYTEYKKEEVKQYMFLQATTAGYYIRQEQGKKDFYADVSRYGDERYSSVNKRKVTEVVVDKSGVARGYKVELNQNGQAVGDRKELNSNQVKRELKSMRKKADEVVRRVSDAETAEERLNAIPEASQISQLSLSDVWYANRDALRQVEPEVAAQHQEQIRKQAAVTAQDVLDRRMNEVKGR